MRRHDSIRLRRVDGEMVPFTVVAHNLETENFEVLCRGEWDASPLPTVVQSNLDGSVSVVQTKPITQAKGHDDLGRESLPSKERDEAVAIANRLLDEPMADPDDDLRVLARQFMRALERAPHEPAAAQDDRKLRELLAFAYSCHHLYGDDGELQDNRRPPIDYRRDSVADIERKMSERGLEQLRAAQPPGDGG